MWATRIDSNSYSWRPISPGTQYDSYFPKPSGQTEIINRNSTDIAETMRLVYRNTVGYAGDTAKIAPLLVGEKLEKTLENIWNFTYRHIQYKIDEPGKEQVRRPARTWADRKQGVDCDCMSVFIGSILHNLGIPFAYRIARYAKNKSWQHIYVIVPVHGSDKYYTLDCVLHKFNYEKKPLYEHKDFHIMELSSLNGFGAAPKKPKKPGGLVKKALSLVKKPATQVKKPGALVKAATSLVKKPAPKTKQPGAQVKKPAPKLKEVLNKAKDKIKKVGEAFVKVAGAPSRNAFLGFLKLTKFVHIAAKLREGAEKQWRQGMKSSPAEWQKWRQAYLDLSKMWVEKLQGSQFALDRALAGKAVAEGNTLKGLGRALSHREWLLMDMQPMGCASCGSNCGMGCVDPSTCGVAAGIIAAASPIIIAVIGVLQKNGVMSKDKSPEEWAKDILGDGEFQNQLNTISETFSPGGGEQAEFTPEPGGENANGERTAADDEDFFQKYKTELLIGGGVVVAGVGYYFWSNSQNKKPAAQGLNGAPKRKAKPKSKRVFVAMD